ncbi:type II toxin-antitoxin system death-on-curing family toxin [Pantoea sp. Bo_2]|uniref:Type II toxin-antitoxin system death-on-curing family toxin n=1 Tax=Candidatus Pantoea gossypiicola TaxID=2608008 RepID=A0AB34CLA1_9GAMM|nr:MULTISPECIES: type II toxin-antitoxin system death-on-curing family toxin [Pantoea]KAA5931461.1 type II toxin-antitoxin system death-on-curing family toxin [Pantoea sp. VH_8]KAA5936596.1 type II toxin-antitoxin system death-on-curing family toxin [Pantoea sp. VH_4]KAA5948197.1 type II toxin-antitoxin system death-on-curing family toxin [Pantoea sp. VH_3]KAA5950469.1 type II toxin-antitoxin system death-on-curing family toxin [Pantoea sp. VH_24]KAA5953467.1 type II toxin-antitoxin system dea
MKWVSAQEVIAFHDRLLIVLPGIKGMPEPQRAEAIIYRVQNQLYYEGVEDIFVLAAIYLIAISRGHIFNDDNKRTAFFVTMVFLNRNGIAIRDEDNELEELTVSAATGEATTEVIAAVLRRLSFLSP